ncbi:SDR family NAD(P)-dependent oxidoreductase [Azohydromonas lata]|uniref:SDR family NAD(P)-dependent oxidoreductase n=1 Tax=Azohydromonas lata TaxID=45677 RepID=A0ABU5I9G5_9BURK|nr:SDR family NAD(P)-dependent oxidoreductase [Azohydromonas lata]MDZ5455746.1 SDR family NAD(P)-dependent oxidoreductase [Azohydromonas lata]
MSNVNNNLPLAGQVALVTGGSRGIGAAIVRRLAHDGADVVFSYSNSPDRADQVANDVKALGRRALAVQADQAKTADVERLVRTAHEAFGRLDILVNSAGVFITGWTDSLCKKVRLWLRPVAFELFRVITYFSAQTELAPKHQPWSEPADDRWRPPLSPSRVGTPLPAPRQRCPHLPIASLDATACRGG